MRFVFVDTETTGNDRQRDELVEVAAVLVDKPRTGRPMAIAAFSTLANPGCPIPAQATAIHGIADADVDGAPPADEVRWRLASFIAQYADALVVAHNAAFDAAFLRIEGITCSLRLARHLDPEAPSHSLGELAKRYEVAEPSTKLLGVQRIEKDFPARLGPHRALGDALTGAAVFSTLVDYYAINVGSPTANAVAAFAAAPLAYKTMPWGKHRGKPLEELPPDYVRWLLSVVDDDDLARELRVRFQPTVENHSIDRGHNVLHARMMQVGIPTLRMSR